MIERIAFALANEDLEVHGAQAERELSPGDRSLYRDRARAALRAMRNPGIMLAAKAWDEVGDKDIAGDIRMEAAFTAMIDAALAEEG